MTVTQLKKYSANQLIDFAINALKALKTMIGTTTRTLNKVKSNNGRRGRKVFPDTKEGKKQARKVLDNYKKMIRKNKRMSVAGKKQAIATRGFSLGLYKGKPIGTPRKPRSKRRATRNGRSYKYRN